MVQYSPDIWASGTLLSIFVAATSPESGRSSRQNASLKLKLTRDKETALLALGLRQTGSGAAVYEGFGMSGAKAAPVRVCVTGAAGQLAYSLLATVAKGDVFGKDQPLILSLLDVTCAMQVLNGIRMELTDCGFPLLKEVILTDDAKVAFKDADAVFLIGSAPHEDWMKERKDFLKANAKIFREQGQVLGSVAKKSVKILVVANPANTNAWICSQFASSIPRENFSCLTRLDHTRTQAQIANRLGVPIDAVKNVIIWGNHSDTQYPDVGHASVIIGGKEKPVPQAVGDDHYIKNDLITTIRRRGFDVLDARKRSSAMSAAKAATDHMRDWWCGTEKGRWVPMGVLSKGDYGIPEGLMYSFPVTIANKQWTVVPGLEINSFAREKMDLTAKELHEEKEAAKNICEL
ncbi:malate dehydrogenase, cytoplasmic-like [Babylonia areolata]|uniref:malate dehydrogenase, cytoplasmic-like n=1 Tax=Babylonia areolata TaxID=304850 RepID=UPI003FD0A04B